MGAALEAVDMAEEVSEDNKVVDSAVVADITAVALEGTEEVTGDTEVAITDKN